MKEITREHIDYLERTLKNWYYLKKQAQLLKKQAFILDIKIEDERKASGISYDKEAGTYNNTDTPYIISLIQEQASYDLDAQHYEYAAIDLDKRNKLTERISMLSKDQLDTVQWLCKEGITQAQYAKKVNVSRQAISDRMDNALKRMLEVE